MRIRSSILACWLRTNLHPMCNVLTSKHRRTRCNRARMRLLRQAVSDRGQRRLYPSRCDPVARALSSEYRDQFARSLSEPVRAHPHIIRLRSRRPGPISKASIDTFSYLHALPCRLFATRDRALSAPASQDAGMCAFYKTLYPEFMHSCVFDRRAFEHLEATQLFRTPRVSGSITISLLAPL